MVTTQLGRCVTCVAIVAAVVLAAGCGPSGRDVFDPYNSRDTGPWLALGRAQGATGALVVHVAAAHPEHAESIARRIVRQNYATSARPIRVIVDDASGSGDRRVYRWDGGEVSVDTSTDGLPPAPTARQAAPHQE